MVVLLKILIGLILINSNSGIAAVKAKNTTKGCSAYYKNTSKEEITAAAVLQMKKAIDEYVKVAKNANSKNLKADEKDFMVRSASSNLIADLETAGETLKNFLKNNTIHSSDIQKVYDAIKLHIARSIHSGFQSSLSKQLYIAFIRSTDINAELGHYELPMARPIQFTGFEFNEDKYEDFIDTYRAIYAKRKIKKDLFKSTDDEKAYFQSAFGFRLSSWYSPDIFINVLNLGFDIERQIKAGGIVNYGFLVGILSVGGQNILKLVLQQLKSAKVGSDEQKGLIAILYLFKAYGQILPEWMTFKNVGQEMMGFEILEIINDALYRDGDARLNALRKLHILAN